MTRFARLVAVCAAPFILTGCLLLPGKFDSTLRLTKDGSYDFTYVGEMQIMSPDEKEMKAPEATAFDPDKAYCSSYTYGDETEQVVEYRYWQDDGATLEAAADDAEAAADEMTVDGDDSYSEVERECTAEELATMKTEEEDRIKREQEEYERNSGMMAAMFGGAFPGNDESLREFARNLAKYDGWDKVEYVGNNKFAVEYRASGRFDNYFAFPVLPDASSQFPFFHIVPRTDGRVEVMSPVFGGAGNGSFMSMMMLGSMAGGGGKDMPEFSEVEGTFNLITDAEVVANNAPDGYASDADGMKTMQWQIGLSGTEGPRALLALAR